MANLLSALRSAGLEQAPAWTSFKAFQGSNFEQIADLLPVGLFRTDAVGRRIYVNAWWTRIAGLSVAEAKGDGWLNAIHPEDRSRVQSEWEQTVGTRRAFRVEYRFQRPSGETMWVLGEAVPEFDAAGNLTGFLGMITDISGLRDVTDELRLTAECFRLAFDFAPHGMAIVDPTGRFVQVNRLLCQMLGYSEAELLAMRFQDISHPDELGASVSGARMLLEKRIEHFELEKRYVRKDKSVIWVKLRTSLVRGAEDQPRYFVSHIQDITERKEAEAALRESEERYWRLVDVCPDGILIHNHNKVVFVNPAAVRIFRASSLAQFQAIEVIELVHPDFRPVVQERIRNLKEGSNFQPFNRETLLRFDGTTVHVEAAGVPFVYEGQPGIQVIIRDVSDIVAAEQERDQLFREVATARDSLQTLSRRLVQVQESERRRIALELHDQIGQELTGLLFVLQSGEDATTERGQTCPPASGTSSSADKVVRAPSVQAEAQARVQKLLELVRELSLDLRPTMLDDLGLVPALLWHFDRYSAVSRINVDFRNFGIEGRRFASEIETAAYRIIQEALTNVLRHSGATEVAVTVWASEQSPWLSIQIEDSGAGFDVEAVGKSGLSSGLTGMRERASLLGGRLLVESAPGKGTCVTTELPLEPKPVIKDVQL